MELFVFWDDFFFSISDSMYIRLKILSMELFKIIIFKIFFLKCYEFNFGK